MKTNEKFNVIRRNGNWIVDSTIIPVNSNDIDSSVELKNFKFYIAKSGDLLISRREIIKETVNLILVGVATDGRVSVHKNLGGKICMKFSKFMESPVNIILEFNGDNVHQMRLYVKEKIFNNTLKNIGCNEYKNIRQLSPLEFHLNGDTWCIFIDSFKYSDITIRTSGMFNANVNMIMKIDFTGVPIEERWCKIDLIDRMSNMPEMSVVYVDGLLTNKLIRLIKETNKNVPMFKVIKNDNIINNAINMHNNTLHH